MKAPPSSQFKIRSYLWPVLVGLLVLLQILFPYKGWLMLLIGLGGAWLISFLWARSLAQHVTVTRAMRLGWAQVGDTLEENFSLNNTGFAPALWLEVIDHSTIPGREAARATGIGGNAQNSWELRQVCSRRGLFTLGPTTLQTGDLFGIYQVSIENRASATLLVTPPVLSLPTIQVAGGGRAGEGRPARKALEQSISTVSVRDYVPGDNLRWIHWATTARRNQLYVKTFDNTPVSDWWIILDLDQKHQYGQDERSTEETGVILAASLAARGLKSSLGVGLIANARELAWLPARMGETQNLRIMQALARVSPGPQPLSELLQNALSVIRTRSSLILITASVEGDWLKSVLSFRDRGIIPTILLMDPQSFGGEETAETLYQTLYGLGIATYVITPDLLEETLVQKKPTNAWEWRVTGTGRAVPIHRPDDMSWKVLS